MADEINDKHDVENEKNRKASTTSSGDYEVYIQRYQEYSLKKIKVNEKNANDHTFFQKLLNRKWWVIGASVGGIVVTGLAVGLPLHFKNNTSINDTQITLTQTISLPTAMGIQVTAAQNTVSNIYL